jgi:UDP-N-acetylmuramyl tripeptide synthase
LSVRLSAAVAAGQAAALLSRRIGLGGGTVIAGHVVRFLDPQALRAISSRLPQGSIIVSGTNGKTTTSRLIASMLTLAGVRPLHNRAGANLMTGLTTAVIQRTSIQGIPQAGIGVFEVDEATVPAAVAEIQPRILLLTNLFRDQLDRYGEVEFVATLWREMVQGLPDSTLLVLNADDPLISALGEGRDNVLYFGLSDTSVGTSEMPHALDARLCVRCGSDYQYDLSYYGHLGHYSCPSCGLRRPEPSVNVVSTVPEGDRGSHITLSTPLETYEIDVKLPGLYNVYNAAAAAACASALSIPPRLIKQGIEQFEAAFGRLERIQVEDRELLLALVKNPVGFNEVLRSVLPADRPCQIVLAINDLFADGTDISWLWDVDFETLQDRPISVVCSGTRADDMAVRLKYALVPPQRIIVEPVLERALEIALSKSEPGETIFVLPTYTAMLEGRTILRRTGYVRGFWED